MEQCFYIKYLSPVSIILCQKAYLYLLKLTTETRAFFSFSLIGLLIISSVFLMPTFISELEFQCLLFHHKPNLVLPQ